MKTETRRRSATIHEDEKSETESDVPQFRVISIRNLAERCE